MWQYVGAHRLLGVVLLGHLHRAEMEKETGLAGRCFDLRMSNTDGTSSVAPSGGI